ncbi:MAG TPA: hypothetical protein VGP82_08850 [Ktedonobacterales bacterium]|jgi:hypothetical protein|nr:hypothetical protein [Ktedonobacterales bacterium]
MLVADDAARLEKRRQIADVTDGVRVQQGSVSDMLRILGHLLMTAFRTLGRLLVTAVLFAALGAAVVMLVASRYTQLQWPPSQPVAVAMIGVAALAAYTGGITSLMVSSVKALLGTAKLAEREATAPIRMVEQELQGSER